MSRCKHCNKLTHSEDLNVSFDVEDHDKIQELLSMENWTPKYMYASDEERMENPYEYGKLKVGDIYIHFIATQG